MALVMTVALDAAIRRGEAADLTGDALYRVYCALDRGRAVPATHRRTWELLPEDGRQTVIRYGQAMAGDAAQRRRDVRAHGERARRFYSGLGQLPGQAITAPRSGHRGAAAARPTRRTRTSTSSGSSSSDDPGEPPPQQRSNDLTAAGIVWCCALPFTSADERAVYCSTADPDCGSDPADLRFVWTTTPQGAGWERAPHFGLNVRASSRWLPGISTGGAR